MPFTAGNSCGAFVVQAYEIPSGSMVPTLEVGDRVFVSKLAYGARLPFTEEAQLRWGSPSRGEVVVFSDPRQGIDLIKRVVAVGGDRVEMKDDVLRVNGQPVPRTPLGECRSNVDTFCALAEFWLIVPQLCPSCRERAACKGGRIERI